MTHELFSRKFLALPPPTKTELLFLLRALLQQIRPAFIVVVIGRGREGGDNGFRSSLGLVDRADRSFLLRLADLGGGGRGVVGVGITRGQH